MATDQVKNKILEFFEYFRKMSDYFRKQLTPPARLPANHELLAAKMAACSLLDALSVTRFPSEKKHRNRLCDFIEQCSNWPFWDRVSVPQLLYRLKTDTDARNEGVRKYVERCLAGRQEYALTDDPAYGDLVAKYPKSDKKLIEECRQLYLFYDYRCALVHEMRAPGYGSESASTLEPFYLSATELPTNRRTFQLTYPLAFFFGLCDQCTTSLERWFLAQNASPFDAYENRFGDVWHRP
jgi:hypothetical protein